MVRDVHDLIFVDKRGDEGDGNPDTWAYFRITSGTGLGNPPGTEGSTVQACRIAWPELEDIQPSIDSSGLATLAVAYATVNKALLQRWAIVRERSVLIGIRDRKG
jgi:hypothetical protein